MNVRLYLISIIIFSVVLAIGVASFFRSNSIVFPANKNSICKDDANCEWRITNCCSENAGAKWECVNLKTFKAPECPSVVICPQVISPKPTSSCSCENGNCVVK